MFKKKYKKFNDSPNKSELDKVLWFIENYFPQKKDIRIQKKHYIHNIEKEIINQFSKLHSLLSNKLFPTTKYTTISFTFGNWALPYLKFLKKIRIAK